MVFSSRTSFTGLVDGSGAWPLLALVGTFDVLASVFGKGPAHVLLPGESREQWA